MPAIESDPCPGLTHRSSTVPASSTYRLPIFVPAAKAGFTDLRSAGRSAAIGAPPHSTTASEPRITMTSVSQTALLSFVPAFIVFSNASRDGACGLQLFDAVPPHAQFHQEGLRVLRGLRGARGLDRLVVELHRTSRQLHWSSAVGRLHFDDHVVRERLLIGGELNQALDRCPLAFHRLQVLTPVSKGLAAD